jgi:hypothetical protein
VSDKIDALRDGSGCAGILDINAKIAPRGAIRATFFVVNGCVFDNIFVYFMVLLTINMLSKAPKWSL